MKKNLSVTVLVFLLPILGFGQVVQWADQVGGTNDDLAISIVRDASGNFYTTGYFKGTVDFDPGVNTFNLTSAGAFDIFISKFNSVGNFIWAKKIGSISDDNGLSIVLDSSGNIYTTGTFKGTVDFNPGAGIFNLSSVGLSDIFISKLDSSGNFIWAKSIGGTGIDDAYFITLDDSDNVYTTGDFASTVDFDPGVTTYNISSFGSSDIFISKLDSSGNFIWAKQMGGTSADQGRSLKLDGSGNIFSTGFFNSVADFDPTGGIYNLTSNGSYDIFISKLDHSGNFIWAKSMGSIGIDFSINIYLDVNDDVYTTGYFNNTVDFDPSAGIFNLNSNGGNDIFISKFDSSGNFIWAKAFGGTGVDVGTNLTSDVSGNILATGYFAATVDFNPGGSSFNLTSFGGNDIFILKLNNTGDFISAKSFGGSTNDQGNFIMTDNSDNLYLAGNFLSDTIILDSDTLINNNNTGTFYDFFLAKFSQTTCNSISTINASVCNNFTSPSGNYTWTVSGTYFDTIPNSGGCDSVITVNLTINSTASSQTITSCNTYISPSGNHIWITSGIYSDTIPNAAGCDSVITINLTINNSTSSTQTIANCNTYTSPSGNYNWSTSGAYMDTIPNAAGCDSVLTINLTINTVTASYTLYPDPDTLQLHHWFAIANVTGTAPIDYLWSWGDGTTDVGATPSHTYSAAAFYAICLTVTDGNSCITTYCDSSTFISKTEEERLIITIDVVTQLPNGIATVTSKENSMSVTPNPCNTCEIVGAETATDLMVTDILGRNQHATFSNSANGYYINLPEASTGIFLIRNYKTGEVVKFVRE